MTSSVATMPRLRGVMHSWLFFLAIPAGIVLIFAARDITARVAAAVYVATVMAGFGVSAAYHRLARSPRARALMQRLDHSTIYVLIAGTYVPICLIALPRSWGIPLLVLVTLGATVGIVLKLVAFGRISWLSYSLYPVLGWSAVLAAPALITHLTWMQLGLVIAGGIAYTVGIPFLILRRPNPWPRVFGYHEIWHSFTAVAAGLHFAAVAALVT